MQAYSSALSSNERKDYSKSKQIEEHRSRMDSIDASSGTRDDSYIKLYGPDYSSKTTHKKLERMSKEQRRQAQYVDDGSNDFPKQRPVEKVNPFSQVVKRVVKRMKKVLGLGNNPQDGGEDPVKSPDNQDKPIPDPNSIQTNTDLQQIIEEVRSTNPGEFAEHLVPYHGRTVSLAGRNVQIDEGVLEEDGYFGDDLVDAVLQNELMQENARGNALHVHLLPTYTILPRLDGTGTFQVHPEPFENTPVNALEILIPIFQNHHWLLLHLNRTERIITIVDSLNDHPQERAITEEISREIMPHLCVWGQGNWHFHHEADVALQPITENNCGPIVLIQVRNFLTTRLWRQQINRAEVLNFRQTLFGLLEGLWTEGQGQLVANVSKK